MPLPQPGEAQIYVKVSALNGGLITLPDHCFVHPSNTEDKRTVPSLAFLIQHPMGTPLRCNGARKSRKMLFDLGLRSALEQYLPSQQAHIRNNRVPYRLGPSIAEQLRTGGIQADDVDTVLLSHVHYDHHGDPEDFENAQFIVGPGSLAVLRNGLPDQTASHQAFDPNLLPLDRTTELPPLRNRKDSTIPSWSPLGPFPNAYDLFSDGSVYIIDSPGHLPGHINLLCRVSPTKWIYLGGDSAHDARLLTAEKEIGTWEDKNGNTQCIHLNREAAEQTIGRIRELTLSNPDVEIILAHDEAWLARNQKNMYPEMLN